MARAPLAPGSLVIDGSATSILQTIYPLIVPSDTIHYLNYYPLPYLILPYLPYLPIVPYLPLSTLPYPTLPYPNLPALPCCSAVYHGPMMLQ